MSSGKGNMTPNVVHAGYLVNQSPDTYDATVTYRFDPPKNGTIKEEKIPINNVGPGQQKKIPEVSYVSGTATFRGVIHRVEAAKKGGNSKASVSEPFEVTGISLDHTFIIDRSGKIRERR
eukprot:Tbor_TRINITY_DN5699_c0_g1::TRINITY_DN5699_c0_g1_i9::g.8777::m.8777